MEYVLERLRLKRLAYAKKYRENNREKVNINARIAYAKNKEKVNINARIAYAKKKNI